MTRLFVGNFDFEETLSVRNGGSQSASVRRVVAELASVWVAAADSEDMLWCPEPIDREFFDRLHEQGLPRVHSVSDRAEIPAGLQLVPWGWTEQAIRWGHSVGATFDSPPLDAVKTVNSRRFSHQFEQERGIGLSGAAEVDSVTLLLEAISRLPLPDAGWVVKAEFSNSSRERFLHRGEPRRTISCNVVPPTNPLLGNSPIPEGHTFPPALASVPQPIDRDSLIRWAQRRLAQGQVLFVEPWVERLDEVGVQITVPRDGKPTVEGVTRLVVDNLGLYRGSEFAPLLEDDPQWQAAIAVGLEFAEAAQQTGYFGPLGIDAMCYQDATGNVRLRPVQDVNARWTMGRLSLGLRRLVSPGGSGTWRHGARSASPDHYKGEQNPNSREIVTSPKSIGGRPVRLPSSIQIVDPP